MEICSCMGTSISEDGNSFHELSVDPPQCTSRVEGKTVNDLGTGLTEFLTIQEPNCKNGVEKADICEEPQQSRLTTITSDKCLSKSATFPRPIKITSSAASMDGENEGEPEDDLIAELLAENADAKSVDSHHTRSKSLPTPLKLVSAMKGGREKQGTPLKKRTVTWAPDVYDPLPTAVSHVVTSKSQRHHRSNSSKKNSRSKQKGSSSKASRGSSRGKDKKQAHRAHGGTSSRCLKSLDEEERVVDFYEPRAVDFDVGSPDPYCGSSFLKKTVTKLHFSVAEAT